MRPPPVQHYHLAPATEQKVIALAKRPETQARDVFDLELLMRRAAFDQESVPAEVRKQAAEAAVELGYADFTTQVLPFLEPSVAALYDQGTSEAIQDFVAGELL